MDPQSGRPLCRGGPGIWLLIATSRSRLGSRALKTTPMPILRVGSKINWVFWRGEDKAAQEGETGILFIRRCSLTPAAVAAARQNAEVIFESALRTNCNVISVY